MNNQNMNNITAATNESHEISINITGKAFVGLARQGMLCHQGILEGCDDALAAALVGEKARICVALAPDADKNYIHLAVADWGCGMDLAALTNALQLGSAPLTNSRLNEHGDEEEGHKPLIVARKRYLHHRAYDYHEAGRPEQV